MLGLIVPFLSLVRLSPRNRHAGACRSSSTEDWGEPTTWQRLFVAAIDMVCLPMQSFKIAGERFADLHVV
jgi:hypothetical protein